MKAKAKAKTKARAKAKTRQYTVRDVPARVDRELRKRAAERGVSLNLVVLEALEGAAGLGSQPKLNHDFDEFVGTWVDDPAFDRAIAEERVVDPRDWE